MIPYFPPPVFPIEDGHFFDRVPIGAIITWAGNIPSATSPPTSPPASPPAFDPQDYGWLICDGRSLDAGEYFQLYCVLANTYGGDSNTFNLPNLQGYFLRAVDINKNVDQDPRNPPAGDANSIVGTTQECALETHTHPYTQPNSPGTVNIGTDGTTPAVTANTQNVQTGPPDIQSPPNANPVSNYETRPVNVAVYFLIKAKSYEKETAQKHPAAGFFGPGGNRYPFS